MIIHKSTKSVETLSGHPNENFGNYPNVFIVDDNCELGKRILANIPFFEIVLDGEGNLADVIPTERPPAPPPEPNQDDYLLDLDYRLSMTELGL